MHNKEATESRLTLATISASTNNTELSFKQHSRWCPSTRKEKTLCFLVIILFLISVGLLLGLIVLYKKTKGENRRICETQSCIEAAAVIMANMDPDQDPCDDFYRYACGGFEDRVIIPEDQYSVNSFNSIGLELQAKLKNDLEEPIKPTDPLFYQLLKNFYMSCINEDAIEELKQKPLMEIYKQLGGWPVLEGSNWKEDEFDWKKTVAQSRKLGVYMNFLIDVSVVRDIKNSSWYTLQLDQPHFGMPDRSYLMEGLNNTLVQAYLKLMTDTAVLLGANETTAKEELKETLEFEMMLAKAALPKEEMRNFTVLYNKMTVGELQKFGNQVNWTTYINSLDFRDRIVDEDQIIVVCPTYVKGFVEVISTSNNRVIANYLMWRIAKSLLDLLDRRFQLLLFEYTRVLTGSQAEVPRPYQCLDVVSNSLDIALGAVYVRKHFQQKSKQMAQELVKEVRQQFYKTLDSVEWFDDNTRDKAMKKAHAMVDYIAYPDELVNDTIMNEFYKGVKLDEDKYFQNVLRMNKFDTDFFLSRLRQSTQVTNWVETATAVEVNAYYKFADNSMQFFAAILNGAFFDPDRPKYMNYGSMGFIVGHEITHGFDDMGRQYDEHGNLNNWWGEETDKKFKEKSECIVQMYGNFTVPEINKKVNGINTQGENIADIGAVKNAYGAYLNWVKKNGPEPELPGLKLTPRQIFWLSNANVWCSKERLAYLLLEVNTNPHSPSRFRVNGPLSNSVEFSQDFNCPVGSNMNLKNKCTIW